MPRPRLGAAFCIFLFGFRWNPQITKNPYFVPLGGEIHRYVPARHPTRGKSEMKKLIFAGVLALAAGGLFSITTSPTFARDLGGFNASQDMASIDIGRVKRVLHLTADQEAYWPPVEAALRDIARRQ